MRLSVSYTAKLVGSLLLYCQCHGVHSLTIDKKPKEESTVVQFDMIDDYGQLNEVAKHLQKIAEPWKLEINVAENNEPREKTIKVIYERELNEQERANLKIYLKGYPSIKNIRFTVNGREL